MTPGQSDTEVDLSALLAGFDLFDAEQERYKWQVVRYARRRCPVARTQGDGPWLVTRYEDARRVLLDPQTFSSAGVAPRPSPVPLPPLDADPPYQPQLRGILNPHFSRGNLARFEPEIRAIAGALVEDFAARGECEVMADYATPLVAGILARIVFDEPDRSRTEAAVEAVMRNATENTPESFLEIARLAGEFLSNRRGGDRSETVLNALATATLDDGRRLSIDEQVAVVTTLFLGGLDTTRGAIGLIVALLADDEALERRLRRPGWERTDIDELVRLTSPVKCLGRVAARDVDLGGVRISAGEQLLVHFASANRDEDQFADPDRLDFTKPRPHVGFGIGIHRCLGAQLARLQIQLAVEELLGRVTRIRLADGAEVRPVPGIASGVHELPIRFDMVPTEADSASRDPG